MSANRGWGGKWSQEVTNEPAGPKCHTCVAPEFCDPVDGCCFPSIREKKPRRRFVVRQWWVMGAVSMIGIGLVSVGASLSLYPLCTLGGFVAVFAATWDRF